MTTTFLRVAAGALVVAACAPPHRDEPTHRAALTTGSLHTVRDSMLETTLDLAGVAEPMQRSTLGTRLMGTVVEVLAKEGDVVASGQVLVRIDARDLAAKASQVAASIAEADALHRDALTQAARMRTLYADSAATRAQLDGAETALARADAGGRVARAASEELRVVRGYADIRAPFAGVVTRRFVDAGAFAAPGTPLVTVDDASRLRVSAHATPDAVRGLRRGQPIAVTIEGRPARAVIEGVVPAASGNLYTVNAVVDNRGRTLLSGSTATLSIPLGRRATIVIPTAALRHEGDLTGVTLRTDAGDETRWVRIARLMGTVAEIGSGLRVGDRIVVPGAVGPTATPRAPVR